MIATFNSVPYDIMLALHIILAVAAMAVFVVLRMAGAKVAKGASAEVQKRQFPQRSNMAARVVHLMPVTGMALVGIGGATVSFKHAYIGIAMLLWLLAAGHLEARVLPAERRLAAAIASDGVASPQSGATFGRSVDVLLTLVALAFIVMIWQPLN
jgi:hypothetical protein